MRKPARAQKPWSESEDAYLSCPIPASYLARGALAGRPVEGIRWRRRKLGLICGIGFGAAYVPLSTAVGRRRELVEYWPDVDWNLSDGELRRITGLGNSTIFRLRREAGAGSKPYREGRRKYHPSDFPDVDWNDSTRNIIAATGLSRTVVYRLRSEWISPELL